VSTRYAGRWPFSRTNLHEALTVAAAFAADHDDAIHVVGRHTAASCRSWVARQISLCTSMVGKRSCRRSMIDCVSHMLSVV